MEIGVLETPGDNQGRDTDGRSGGDDHMGDIFDLAGTGDAMLRMGLVIMAVTSAWWFLTENRALGAILAAAAIGGAVYVANAGIFL